MALYLVTLHVEATGTQNYAVEAESPEDAQSMVENGEGTFEDEHYEPTQTIDVEVDLYAADQD